MPAPKQSPTDERNLFQRIHAAQKNFTPIVKNKVNPHFKNRFADLDSVVTAVEESLSNEGVLIVGTAQPHDSTSWLVGVKLVNIDQPQDCSAQYIPCNVFDSQKQGAAITYARRYLLCLMLNLLTEDDDDGNIASGLAPTGSVTTSKPPTPTVGEW